jgi:MOSC domain-containing protein YiiM
MEAIHAALPEPTELKEVRTGQVKRLNDTKIMSAIDKVARVGKVHVGPLGLEGDEQGQKPLHGGPEKAVLHYATHHYEAWIAELPGSARFFKPGGFGENLVSSTYDETTVCIGDKIRIGGALLQVAQPRQPCFKLNHRFQQPSMSMRAQESGRTGWYYRVLESGEIGAGDMIQVVERPHPEWSVRRVQHYMYTETLDVAALEALINLGPLAQSTRALFEHRMKSMNVESWNRRLTGIDPAPLAQPNQGKQGE